MDFNRIKEMGLEYAEKGKNAALDLAEKGKTQALIVNEQGKLLKAQRQLGALVYSLAKGKEENQPLVDKYIEMIDHRSPLQSRKLLPPRLRLQSTRAARSAVRPFRTMHCSAISAAHSCNLRQATGRRSPQGTVLFFAG